jgi:hypothetical protein
VVPTWEALPVLADVRTFVVGPARADGRNIVALVPRSENQRAATLHRSADAGSTWQPALTLAARFITLHLSPDFVHDGPAFALADG